MKTYLTISNDGRWGGKRIQANSWDEAEQKCPDGYKIDGELIEEIDAPEWLCDFYRTSPN